MNRKQTCLLELPVVHSDTFYIDKKMNAWDANKEFVKWPSLFCINNFGDKYTNEFRGGEEFKRHHFTLKSFHELSEYLNGLYVIEKPYLIDGKNAQALLFYVDPDGLDASKQSSIENVLNVSDLKYYEGYVGQCSRNLRYFAQCGASIHSTFQGFGRKEVINDMVLYFVARTIVSSQKNAALKVITGLDGHSSGYLIAGHDRFAEEIGAQKFKTMQTWKNVNSRNTCWFKSLDFSDSYFNNERWAEYDEAHYDFDALEKAQKEGKLEKYRLPLNKATDDTKKDTEKKVNVDNPSTDSFIDPISYGMNEPDRITGAEPVHFDYLYRREWTPTETITKQQAKSKTVKAKKRRRLF